jgi:transposase
VRSLESVCLKRLTIDDPALVAALQNEIRRSDQSRYDHRLHSILLVAQGMSCREAASVFGDSVRTVQTWLHRFEEEGLAGLVDADRAGRPPRLSDKQLKQIERVLRDSPRQSGIQANLWDGKTLSAFIQRRFGITLQVRQCQRLFRQFGFRLRKPRPMIAHADPSVQDAFKKN